MLHISHRASVLLSQSRFLEGFSRPPGISRLRSRKVLDGAGGVTLEVEVECTVRNTDQRICSATISADEAPPPACDSNHSTQKERMMGVETAIQWIEESIGPLLRGIQPERQSTVDSLLRDFFKLKMEEERRRRDAEPPPPLPPSPPASKKRGSGKGRKAHVTEKPISPAEPPEPVVKGSLAVGAVSLAIATSAAVLQDIPLYCHIAALRDPQMVEKLHMPLPLITVLSCGRSSPGKLWLMEEVMIVPEPSLSAQQSVDLALSLQTQIIKLVDGAVKSGVSGVSALGCPVVGLERLEEPLELIGEACRHLGLRLGTDVYLAINCAAHRLMDEGKGKYQVLSGSWRGPGDMVDLYCDLISRHPAIMALVDPLRREDRPQWEMLGKAIGSRCYLFQEVASKSISSLLQVDITHTLPPLQGDVTHTLPPLQGDVTHTLPPLQGDVTHTLPSLQGDVTHNLPPLQGDVTHTLPPLQSDVTPASSGSILKHANQTTICELLEAVRRIEGERRVVVVGCAQEEGAGVSVVDLAVGLGAPFIKLGGLLRGERSAKYNRLLAVHHDLQHRNMLAGSRSQFDFPAVWSEMEGAASEDSGTLKRNPNCPSQNMDQSEGRRTTM